MDTMTAFALSQANQHKTPKVFDWDEAARILRDRGAQQAVAGLQFDLEWTAGLILKDGQPFMEGYTYLLSVWAKPVLVLDDEEIECFVMCDQTEWDEHTKWPQSALDIFNATPTHESR